ncbi:MAG: S-layer homology domain-containing protein [Clostridia bacterium]|nr:S-layer homology domain-containing protein [Clostridia bacterium]
MTKISKVTLSLILCLTLCFPVAAANLDAGTEYLGSYTVENEGGITAHTSDPYALSVSAEAGGSEYIDTFDDFVREIVRRMEEREEHIVLKYSRDSVVDDGFFDTLFERIFQHTGDPRGGDYLRYQYSNYKCSYEGFKRSGICYYTFTFSLKYYTNTEQEAAVDRAVEKIVQIIKQNYTTDYEKTIAIYRFVTNNTEYDNENLNNSSYKLKYSAYAALLNKTAVCQGYANLIYRLALELGIDCRIISGIGNGGAHAWNIIRGDDGRYYLFDATWDAQRIRADREYAYIFCGSEEFDDHIADESFLTAEFTSRYPISTDSYKLKDVGHISDGAFRINRYATSVQSGEKSGICLVCGAKSERISIPYVHAEDVYKNYVSKSWSEDGINFVSSNGLMGDTGNGDFKQTGKMTRSMFVTVLYRLAGSPTVLSASPFTDLDPAQSWYHNAVVWAYENGIVTGTSAATFAPNAEVTREQIATFLYRYTVNYLKVDVSGVKNDISSFPDAGSVGSYAKDALAWANGVGLIKGQSSGDKSFLAPKNDATREEVAVIIFRFCTAE